MGLGFCLYTTFMWLTKLDTTHLRIGQYLDMAIILLPVSVILLAIRQENRKQKIGVPERMLIAVFVGLISFIIYDPFLYIYHQFINPDWFGSVLDLKQAELVAANTDPEVMSGQLQKMRESNVAQSQLFRLGALIPSVIVIPAFIALISLAFVRTKENSQQE
jgi:hypothetical protein